MYPAATLVTIATANSAKKRGTALTNEWTLNSIPINAKNKGAKKPNVIAEIVPYTLL
jgi:hypothetical protein